MNTPLQNAIEISAALRETAAMLRRARNVAFSYLSPVDVETVRRAAEAARQLEAEREAGE